MSFEQLHFAIGMILPFIISLFFWNKKQIFYFPFIMTFTGIFAVLPYYLGLNGGWTNIFFFYDLISKNFSRGQFMGYILIIGMFIVVVSLQSFYLWRKKNA